MNRSGQQHKSEYNFIDLHPSIFSGLWKITSSPFWWSHTIEDITAQLTFIVSKNIFILLETLTLLPQATPNIHFKETIMRKMQLLHYDCCVSFGKQNMYPVTTAGSFYCLYEPTYFPVIWPAYLIKKKYFNVKK